MTRVLLLVAGTLLALSSPVLAAEPRTNLVDLEDEVMCPICGTLLELAEAPQADRQRAFISELIAGGRTKQQIKDELVAEYGPRVLALPRGSGFELSAYLVPAIAFAVGALALALGIGRWRRKPGSPAGGRRPPPSDEDAQRLEADLARYDL
jgi:cytochrome c-type biogenesis protein CcmH